MKRLIAKAPYEGYIWYSDSKRPEVFDGTREMGFDLDDADRCFVIEGYLWNGKDKESVAIRYVDGHYYIETVQVTDRELQGIGDDLLTVGSSADQQVATTVCNYVAHRIEGVKGLRFLRYWQGEPDDMCEGMEVLRPSQLVFIGFEK